MIRRQLSTSFFFFNDTATTEIYTLSLHDALPICVRRRAPHRRRSAGRGGAGRRDEQAPLLGEHLVAARADRKSTRLNSSHGYISYAVFCLKKKKKKIEQHTLRRAVTHLRTQRVKA